MFTRMDLHTSLNVDEPGEEVLRDVKGERAIQERLSVIEQELGQLTNAVEMEVRNTHCDQYTVHIDGILTLKGLITAIHGITALHT